MQDYFIWNGTDCREYGIHVTEQPPITIPGERSTQTNVPGRREDVLKTGWCKPEKRDVLHCPQWTESYTLTPFCADFSAKAKSGA